MEEPKSKSQKKREADTLQKLGVDFVALNLEQLDRLSLPPVLKQAILDAKQMKSHGAVRRQAQLIGKLMRLADSEAIIESYGQLMAEASATNAEFHTIEVWRTRLINEGNEALTEFVEAHPLVDIQQLRQLIKKAVDEQKKEQHTGAAKALFRFLRTCSA